MKEYRREYRKEKIVEIILTTAFLAGILLAFRELMEFGIVTFLAFLAGVLVLVLRELTKERENLKKRVEAGIYAVSIGIFVLSVAFVVQGFLSLVNGVIDLWNLRFKTEAGKFATTGLAGIGTLILWILLAVFLSSLILTQIQKRKQGILIVLVIVSLGFELVLGQKSGSGSVVCLLVGIFGSFLFFGAPKRLPQVRQITVFIAVFAGILIGFVLCGAYQKIQGIENWKKETVDAFEQFRYGKDTLPKGELGQASGLLEGTEERLVLTMDTAEELYLKGFVGGSYEGTKWEPLSADKYQSDYDGMLEWLEEQGFSAVSQYALYQTLTQESTGGTIDNKKVTVENTGAYRKYLYLPYCVANWQSANDAVKKDWQVLSKNFFGASDYEFEMSPNAPDGQKAVPSAWLESPENETQTDYLNTEEVYHSFVENSYLDVNENIQDTINTFFFDGEVPSEETDFEEVTSQIRQALRLQTSYNETPQDVPEGQEFITWFLNDYKSGNAVSYASAAVLAYRTAGYPARYVEGYHLSADDAQNLVEKNEKNVVLTTKNAHAWVEVYRAGMGWMPIEVVPGMYVETYSNQKIEGKPAYQVQALDDQNGVKTDEEAGTGSGASDDEKKDEKTLKQSSKLLGICIVVFYLVFAVYLILEAQRWIRLRRREQKGKKASGQGYEVWYYTQEMERCFKAEGVRQDFREPEKLWEEAEEKFLDVDKTEYKDTVAVLQKATFGEKELSEYEMRTLEEFLKKLQTSLYQSHSRMKKFFIRYFYCIDK